MTESTNYTVRDEETMIKTITTDDAAVKANFGKNLALNGIEIRTTAVGDITFFNTNYVPEKVRNIFQWFLDTQVTGFSGLYSVAFRMDGHPSIDTEDGTPTSWMVFPKSLATVCNMRGCIDAALFDVFNSDFEEAPFVNTWAVIWRNIIQNFFHEVHHAQAYLTKREALAIKGSKARDDEEQDAIAYASRMMIEAAKAIDIEMQFTAEFAAIIAERLDEEITNIDTDPEATETAKAWAANMKYMTKENVVAHVPAKDGAIAVTYKTLKEWLHAQSGDAEDDPAWTTAPIETTCVSTFGPETTTGPATYTPSEGFIIADSSLDASGYYEDNEDFVNFGEGEVDTTQFVSPINYMPEQTTNMSTNTTQSAPYVMQNTIVNPVQGPPTNGQTQTHVPQMQHAPLGWDANTHQAVVKGLYAKLANSIFSRCGFYVGQQANTPFFMNVSAIETPVELTPMEAQLVQAQTITKNGRFLKDQPVAGNVISGIVIGKDKLQAGYDLTLNDGNGGSIKRKFVPQNPWGNSATAVWARNGQQVVWILDPAVSGMGKCMRVVDGQVMSNSSGKWMNV